MVTVSFISLWNLSRSIMAVNAARQGGWVGRLCRCLGCEFGLGIGEPARRYAACTRHGGLITHTHTHTHARAYTITHVGSPRGVLPMTIFFTFLRPEGSGVRRREWPGRGPKPLFSLNHPGVQATVTPTHPCRHVLVYSLALLIIS